MRLSPFRIEQYFAKHEFSAKYLLSSSDCESCTIQQILDLEPAVAERFLDQWCGYTESPGAPYLRATISGLYHKIGPTNVLIPSCAEEGIFLVYHSILTNDDHVIVETPCFESALEVAYSTGAQVVSGAGGRRITGVIILTRCEV